VAEKQTDADKAAAMTEYRQQHNAAVDRIAALRAARIARDASAPPPAPKVKAKPVAKTGTKTAAKTASKTAPKAASKTATKSPVRAAPKIAPAADAPRPVLLAKRRS
jgi:hypothetical protein